MLFTWHVSVLAKRFEFQGSRFCLLLCQGKAPLSWVHEKIASRGRMVELGPLLAAWPQKAQFDRAARAMGRAGQGAALWELTELYMGVLSRETAPLLELAAAEAEVARLTAEVAQLRAAAPPPPQQPAAPAPPCAAFALLPGAGQLPPSERARYLQTTVPAVLKQPPAEQLTWPPHLPHGWGGVAIGATRDELVKKGGVEILKVRLCVCCRCRAGIALRAGFGYPPSPFALFPVVVCAGHPHRPGAALQEAAPAPSSRHPA